MSYTQINPGQRDWLKQLNDMLQSDNFNCKSFECSMMNGASGWGTELILYNADIYIAQVNSWFSLPAGNTFIDFMNNPMTSVMSFSNSTLTQAVTIQSDAAAASAGYGRVIANASLDNGASWGLYETESSSHTYNKSSYNGLLHIVWMGNRSDLNI